MKLVKIMSSRNYKDPTQNHGDSIILDTGQRLIIYDCGSIDHADRVEIYMNDNGYSTATAILSHHDSDHYTGLVELANRGLLSEIYTHYLLDYKDELRKIIDDDRKTPKSVKEQIEAAFAVFEDILDEVEIKDAFLLGKITDEIELIGPSKDEALDYVAQYLDGLEPDMIESETIFNALSIRVKVTRLPYSQNLLLCGDCHFGAIENVVRDYSIIQLPHHGKPDTADQIFQKLVGRNPLPTYVVSDNTGDSNGGSDDLNRYGKNIKNTKTDGDIKFEKSASGISPVRSSGFLG